MESYAAHKSAQTGHIQNLNNKSKTRRSTQWLTIEFII